MAEDGHRVFLGFSECLRDTSVCMGAAYDTSNCPVISTINLVGDVPLHCLLRERHRLTQSQSDLIRYIANINRIRNFIAQQYSELKQNHLLKRYAQMHALIRDALVFYHGVLESISNELQILRSGDFALLESTASERANDNELQTPDSALHMAAPHTELRIVISQLQLAVANLHEVFKEACAVFQRLAIQYDHCKKYGFLQQYVALKHIIKHASIF